MLVEAVRRACEVGVARARLADVLGVHRATFYRQFPIAACGGGGSDSVQP